VSVLRCGVFGLPVPDNPAPLKQRIPWLRELRPNPRMQLTCRLDKRSESVILSASEIAVRQLTSSWSAPDKGGAPAPPFFCRYRLSRRTNCHSRLSSKADDRASPERGS
jgi:hypothetical protein